MYHGGGTHTWRGAACVGGSQDTEFPGVVARPIGSFGSHTDYHYQTLRCNVDLLKLIQLGLTFADEAGNLVEDCPTWQFNFQCDLECVVCGHVGVVACVSRAKRRLACAVVVFAPRSLVRRCAH